MAKNKPNKPRDKQPTPTAEKTTKTENPAPKVVAPPPPKPEQGKEPQTVKSPSPDPAKKEQSEKSPPTKAAKEPQGQGKVPSKTKPPDKSVKDANLPKPPDPDLKARKEKLEKELREKYGISKSDKPAEPWVAPETEKIVRIPHDQLHGFKGHTFNVDKNEKFMALAASIRGHGVTNPATVRPRADGGYEIVSGHRRDAASIEAGVPYTPCIIRALNDEQAIQQMVEDNLTTRDISTMELARSLNEQLNSIKRQGARKTLAEKEITTDADENIQKRSNAIIAERNGMTVKQVQRHIALTKLSPAMQKLVEGVVGADGKPLKVKFTPAVEISSIQREHHDYIALAIEGNQSTPSLGQAQRMRELDKQNLLKPDIIDGILLEEKKEVDRVIISSQELAQYFKKTDTPRQMKEQIMTLLEDWSKTKEQEKPETTKGVGGR